MNVLIPIKNKIHILRNTEVMLDSDLAELYGVETKRINEAVKNNPDKNMKTTYHVVTVSSGGESQALSSSDQTLISKIVNGITEAIVHRG